MPPKQDDATAGIKTLKIFSKLLVYGKRHFQADLAREFNCSPQTIIRIMGEIGDVIGPSLESGLERRRKWYRISPRKLPSLALDCEELRYLAVCRDMAAPALPKQIVDRIDQTIFNLSLHLPDPRRGRNKNPQIHFYSKGRIDYTPFNSAIEILLRAIEGCQVCLVDYKAAGQKQARTHRVAPHSLISMNEGLYLLGAILTHGNEVRHFVNFAIHRIRKCVLTSSCFDIEFPPIHANSFGLPWHEPREYCVRVRNGKASEYVAERIWSDRQKMVFDSNGDLYLYITTQSEPELRAWVRSFGGSAELLGQTAPAHGREIIKEMTG